MGIFDFLKGRVNNDVKITVSTEVDASASWRPDLPEYHDLRKAVCPYCQFELKKVPGSKTKCPSCENFMYVRTSPKNIREVVTEDEAEKIDEAWSIHNGTHAEYLAEKKRIANRTAKLKQKFGGQTPSDNDVKWSLLNEELLTHMKNRDWGLYRNAKLEMGTILKRESKLIPALKMYLEVCYLDTNGPNNTSGYSGGKSFNPSDGNAFIAPGVIKYIQTIMKKADLNVDDVAKIFVEHNTRFETSMKLPVSVADSWDLIKQEI